MWDAIKDVLTSSNAWFIVIFLMIVFIVGIILLVNGKLIINSKHFKLGSSEKERNIIRQQLEWARYHCEAFEKNVPRVEQTDGWRVKYILEKIYDEIVDWISFNHIADNPSYIGVKQDKIVYLVHSLTTLEIYHSAEVEKLIRDDVEFIIKRLVDIRQLYK